jgi:hypothetical protein
MGIHDFCLEERDKLKSSLRLIAARRHIERMASNKTQCFGVAFLDCKDAWCRDAREATDSDDVRYGVRDDTVEPAPVRKPYCENCKRFIALGGINQRTKKHTCGGKVVYR